MKKHNAFTMLELVFVIVIIGIIGKFGLEFMTQAYTSYLTSSVNNRLQSNSASAIEFIAKRLQYRIRNSVITRKPSVAPFIITRIDDQNNDDNNTLIEWIGMDIDGFRGDSQPSWSGIIDVNHTNHAANILISPGTNTTSIDQNISALSNTAIGTMNYALYFIGSNNDINGYGWNGAITNQQQVMHEITRVAGFTDRFTSNIPANDFTNTDVYEYYQLAWTAYAIRHEDTDGDPNNIPDALALYYNYQPWDGDTYLDVTTNRALIMENVSTFRFAAIGSMIKIQVCTEDANLNIADGGGYSVCKEKVIY